MRIKFKQYIKKYKSNDVENEEVLDDDSGSSDEYEDLESSDEFNDESLGDSDPNRQGEIRSVSGAHLVYKRKTVDEDEVESYEELWIYNISDTLQREMTIKNEIIDGTDIEPGTKKSNDGKQKLDIYTLGNVQYIHITGLSQ